MPTVLDLYDPLRSPSWRSERVEEILKERGRLPSRITDDEDVWRLFRFLSSLQSARNDRERRSIALSDPEIWLARRLRFDYALGGRALIEARILAGQSDEEIARKSGTLAGAVRMFERLYFNVRDRLDARDWILRCILGPEIDMHVDDAGHVTAAQLDAVYRLLGYFGGPIAVDFIGGGCFGEDRPQNYQQLPGWTASTLGALLHRRSLIAAATLRINRYNALELLNTSLRLLEMQQSHAAAREQAAEGSQDLRTVAQQVFAQVQAMISPEGNQKSQQELIKYWESAVEPRLRDWVELKNSGTSAELETLAELNPYQHALSGSIANQGAQHAQVVEG